MTCVPKDGGCRKALEEEIAMHTGAIIQLKYRLNNMAPISKLPPEVLSEIFTHIAVSHYTLHKAPAHSFQRFNYKWITFSHVCRTWRAVALNTPRLWSRIVLYEPRVTEEILARSKQAPLCFTASLNHDSARTKLLGRVMNDARRLKELHLAVPLHALKSLWSEWTTPASILETLSITTVNRSLSTFEFYDIPSTSTISMPVVFSEYTPNLRSLDLHGLPVTWNNPIFCSTLTHMHVASDFGSTFQMGNFSHLLNAVENMPLLQSLDLEESIPSLGVDATTIPITERKICLPHLHTLRVVANDIDSANLINHLSLPASPRIVIHGRLGRGMEELSRVLGELFASTQPLLVARLVHICPDPAHIRCWRSLDSNTVSPPDFELYLEPERRYLHSIQNIVVNASWLAHVQRLLVLPSFSQPEWETLFDRMPELRELTVSAHPNPALLGALSSIKPILPTGTVDNDKPGTLFAPDLRNVQLIGVRFKNPHTEDDAQQYIEKFIDWLILRCNWNVPLEQLDLRECINTAAADVGRLRHYVPCVEWDNEEWFDEWVDEEDEDENEIEVENDDDDDDYSDDELPFFFDPALDLFDNGAWFFH